MANNIVEKLEKSSKFRRLGWRIPEVNKME